MSRERARQSTTEVAEETAHILFLTYGQDAVEMAELRCAELQKAGDMQGAASWKEVLKHVRTLAAANPEQPATSH
jgi:hypothetical protein